jgi:hypothetical protein
MGAASAARVRYHRICVWAAGGAERPESESTWKTRKVQPRPLDRGHHPDGDSGSVARPARGHPAAIPLPASPPAVARADPAYKAPRAPRRSQGRAAAPPLRRHPPANRAHADQTAPRHRARPIPPPRPAGRDRRCRAGPGESGWAVRAVKARRARPAPRRGGTPQRRRGHCGPSPS